MPIGLQVKLLRSIQEEEIRPVGESKSVKIDVRVIAATSRDLELEIREGRFREDLFYRLNVVRLEVPPLRERRQDVPLLVDHFLSRFRGILGKNIRGISDEALDLLVHYRWPGNVRELENVIERAVALSRGSVIDSDALPPSVLNPNASSDAPRIPSEGIDLEATVNEYEKELLVESLRATGGVKKHAAQLVGVSFRSFRYRLEKLGLDGSGRGED